MKIEIYLNNADVSTKIALKEISNVEKFLMFTRSELVYTKELSVAYDGFRDEAVSDVFMMCNNPVNSNGYNHRRLTIGDTIVMTNTGKKKVFFIDLFGYTDITEFLPEENLKPTENPLQYTNTSVKKIDVFLTHEKTEIYEYEVTNIDFFYDKNTSEVLIDFIEVDSVVYDFIIAERKRRGW